MREFIRLYPEQGKDGMIFALSRIIWVHGDTMLYDQGDGRTCQYELTNEDMTKLEKRLLGANRWE